MDDAYAIRLAKTELRDGYNSGNVDRILAVFADAYSDMSSGCASFYGVEAKAVLRHRLKKLFIRYRAKLTVTIISIAIYHEMAFDWGWHQLTLTPKSGGRPRTTRTRYLEIWNKDADGRWKIGIFFDNLDVPPEMPPREVLKAMTGGAPSASNPKRKSRRKPVRV